MKDIKLQEDNNFPTVDFSASNHLLVLEGRSIAENPVPFFNHLIEWTEEYFAECKDVNTTLILDFEYINSSSSKMIYSLLKVFEQNYLNGKRCNIKWLHDEDDEGIIELGEHLASSFEMPFVLEVKQN
jgi:hypothetical protein